MIVYYRNAGGYAHTVEYLWQDVRSARFIPAEDLDRVQRRHSQVNAAHIVSVREAEEELAE